MKKFILKLEVYDDKDKRKAMKIVAALSGIDSITINMKEKSMILIGTVDPISAVSKLRKLWPTYLVSVGPAKEPEKKKEPKKEEPKKEEPKKEEEKKEEPKKEQEKKEEPKKEGKKETKKDEPKEEDGKKEEAPKEEPKKEEALKEEKKSVPQQQSVGMIMPYRPYYPPMHTYYNYQPHHHSIEENPNACVIC